MARALTLLALIALIALSALGCSESGTQEPEATGTIVFTRGDPDYGAEHVWLMSADGSGQRRLSRGYGPAWSPDGGKIAFSVPRNDNTSQIHVIGADGRGRLRLTRPEDVYDTHYLPAWSPNGKTIAFQGYDDGHHWIAVVGADGSGQRTLTPRPTLGFYELDTAPVWSRDGRTITITKESGNAVHAMRPDGSRRRVLTRIEGGSWGRAGDAGLEWSPDRRQFTVLVDADLWVLRADGRRVAMLFDSPVDKPERWRGIAWSPDGRKIAFSVLEGKGPEADSEIYVVDADGNGLRKLTDNEHVLDEGPAWSPDGRAIAFTTNRDGQSEIYVMDADGNDQRNVSQSPLEDADPAWSPRTAP